MIGYIKDPYTWTTEEQVEIISYELPVESANAETGTAIITEVSGDHKRHIFCIDGVPDRFWVITGAESRSNGLTTLTLEDDSAIFDGDILSTPMSIPDVQIMMNDVIGYYLTYAGSLTYVPQLMGDKNQPLRVRGYSINGESLGDDMWMTAYNAYGYSLREKWEAALADLVWTDFAELLKEGGSYYKIDRRSAINTARAIGCRLRFKVGPTTDMYCGHSIRSDESAILYNGHVYRVTYAGGYDYVTAVLDDTMTPDFTATTLFSESGGVLTFKYTGKNIKVIKARHYLEQPSFEYGSAYADLFVCGDKLDYSTPEPVFFDDGHTFLKSESYNETNFVSRAVFFSTTNPSQKKTYYLNSSGTVSHELSDQVKGTEYTTVLGSALTDAICEPLAQEIFDKNTVSHRIEFESDKELHLGQPVKLMLKRGTLDTTISCVKIKSGNNRFYYTCGEMVTSVSDRLRVYNWKYGSRTPKTGTKGSLFIEV